MEHGGAVKITGPSRKLTAITRTDTETIDELTEQMPVWAPGLHNDQFPVNPGCPIIPETKRNYEDKANIRFGVAMTCSMKHRSPEMI